MENLDIESSADSGSERKKFKQTENENDFNNIPNEILWLIFQQVPTKFYTNLSLVCQRWNLLIEERHIFSSRLFAKVRTEGLYELAFKSERKVDLLIIISQASTDNHLHLKYIKKILEKPNNWIGKACLLLRNDSNTFNLNLVIDYLKCVQNLEVLYLNFHRLFFDKIYDIIEPIEFKNLSFLCITDCSHDVVRKCLCAIQTPGNF